MMLVPVMKVDLYELSNNHVWRSDFHLGNFERQPADYMHIERDAKGWWTEWGWIDYGLQNYYALLNCGYRLQPTAGTASGVHPVQLGFSRVYVHLPDEFSYDAWMKGLAAGRSFVTTGPLLFVEVDGEDPGHLFSEAAGPPREHRVTGTVHSEERLSRIEIVVNGEIAKTIRPPNTRGDKKCFLNCFDERITIDDSSWVAVRAFEDRADHRVRFAHSSPAYFNIPGRPLAPRQEELDYLTLRVEEQIARNTGVLSPASIQEYRDALKIYQSMTARRPKP
jgi:hypothetical protein